MFLYPLYVIFSFQSTLPRGERHLFIDFFVMRFDFNPRSHEGSDDDWERKYNDLDAISIHAPTRGATQPTHFLILVT